jgi:hypothetical protein
VKKNNNIVKMTLQKDMTVVNLHNNSKFRNNDILKIEYANGEVRYLDLLSNRDMTDVDYFKIEKGLLSREKVIFYDKQWFNEGI